MKKTAEVEPVAVKDLAIVYRDPASLVADKRNTRLHTRDQIAAIRKSIDEFGFANPILLRDDGVTIGAGHARQAASLLDPPLTRVPTIIIPGLTNTQWRMYVIADNRLAEVGASWDLDTLKTELLDFQSENMDLALTGFTESDLAKMLDDVVEEENLWEGMPEFEQEDLRSYRRIVVHFKDQKAVDDFVALLECEDRFSERTKYLWFPNDGTHKVKAADVRYVAADFSGDSEEADEEEDDDE